MHTGLRNILFGILALVIAVALGVVAFLFVQSRAAVSPPTDGSPSTIYSNPTYDYSFLYPPQYSVQQDSPEYVAVGTSTSGGGFNAVANIDVITPDTAGGYASYNDLVYGTAANDCAADGPSTSISCDGVASSSPYTSAKGLVGEEFYLTQITRTLATGATATSTRGPFYAFNISTDFPNEQFAALLVHVPIAGTDAANASAVTAIASSLQLPTTVSSATTTPTGTQGLEVITNSDMGKTISLTKNQRFVLQLVTGLKWSIAFSPSGIISPAAISTTTDGAEGIYEADAVGTTTLRATGAPICTAGEACPDFLVQVTIGFLVR